MMLHYGKTQTSFQQWRKARILLTIITCHSSSPQSGTRGIKFINITSPSGVTLIWSQEMWLQDNYHKFSLALQIPTVEEEPTNYDIILNYLWKTKSPTCSYVCVSWHPTSYIARLCSYLLGAEKLWGPCFLKITIINRPGKLLLFIFKFEVTAVFADNMTNLLVSVN